MQTEDSNSNKREGASALESSALVPPTHARIGIIGGMSSESTGAYYKTINKLCNKKLGGIHNGNCVIWSFDFAQIAVLMERNKPDEDPEWIEIGKRLAEATRCLLLCGAQVVILATNTIHKCARFIEAEIAEFRKVSAVPSSPPFFPQFIHIAAATAQHIVGTHNKKRPCILATSFTMESTFYTDVLTSEPYNLTPIIPNEAERKEVHRIIFEELVVGVIKQSSRETYSAVVSRLVREEGADCVICACTEVVGLFETDFLDVDNARIPVVDSAAVHCDAAFALACSKM